MFPLEILRKSIIGWDWRHLTSSCKAFRPYALWNKEFHLTWRKRYFKSLRFPPGITSITSAQCNLYKLKYIPQSVKRLAFTTFTANHAPLWFPNWIQHMTVQVAGVSQSIHTWTFPPNLLSLRISQLDDRISLPASLKRLEILDEMICWGKEFSTLPRGLEVLSLGPNTILNITDIKLPDSLVRLRFGDRFNKNVVGWKIPNGLKHLVLGRYFDRDIRGWSLPEGLKSISFGEFFDWPLVGWKPPKSLKFVSLCQGKAQLSSVMADNIRYLDSLHLFDVFFNGNKCQ